MKKIILFLSVITLIASCSSDADPLPAIDVNANSVLVKKIIETEPSGNVITTEYTYDGNKLVKTTDNDGFYEKFFYTGDVITKIEFYNNTNQLEEQEFFEYNSSQQLISFQNLILSFNQGKKEVYSYSGSNVNVSYYDGNVASQTNLIGTGVINFTNGVVSSLTKNIGTTEIFTYTYDTKNSVAKNVLGSNKVSIVLDSDGLYWLGYSFNILTETHTSGGTTTYSYVYNNQNYPVSSTAVENNIGTSTFQFMY